MGYGTCPKYSELSQTKQWLLYSELSQMKQWLISIIADEAMLAT
jgi:hypothetical protein